ncbi:MAG: glycoside hydrolase family 3 N-terminal domain-containing protein [Spirochaetales bacterium]|nr:glycoside hydrolase family 3 N-terminal domain-containing protein [Spirochaetales bacterium]
MLKRTMLLASITLLLFAVFSCAKQDPFENSIYSEQPKIGVYQDYAAESDIPSEGSAPILATGTEKGIIKKHGLEFKDSDGDGDLDPYEDWRLPTRERAEDLVSQMSVNQKLGLLSWFGSTGSEKMTKDTNGTDDDNSDDTLFYGISGLNDDGTIVEKGDDDKLTFANALKSHNLRYGNTKFDKAPMDEVKYNNNLQGYVERLDWGIPFIVSSDPSHEGWNGNEEWANGLSKWPFYIGLGAANDLKVTKEFGETVSRESRMQGHFMLLGPQADIATEPRWARTSTTIHSSGDAVAKHIRVLIKAMQGGDHLSPEGIAVTVKHFPGAGSNEQGMDSHTHAGRYSVFPGNNIDEHLKGFKAAIDAGVSTAMACYSIIDIDEYKDVVNGKPVDEGAAFSKKIMTDLLKDQLGFDGAVVSDWGISGASSWGHSDIKNKPEIFAEMLNAGTYQYGGDDKTETWIEAYNFELIDEATINTAATRALELQFNLGLFENPYIDLTEATAFWAPDGEQKKEREAEGEAAMKKAMVLTKNTEAAADVELLPIKGTMDEYIAGVDTNGNGTVDVFFDSAYPDADSGQKDTKAFSTDKQYLNINFVDDISKADIAVIRIFSRGSTYFGTQGGTPLNYDDPVRVWDHDKQMYTDELVHVATDPGDAMKGFAGWKFNDWSNLSNAGFFGGFCTFLGASDSKAAIERTIAAKKANPKLKIIVGMTASRPGIVSGFIDDIDAMIIDFAATDKAFLDVVFWQDGDSPKGRLPYEIPSSQAAVEAQLEDVANDSANPTFEAGYGLDYVSVGGYGYGN